MENKENVRKLLDLTYEKLNLQEKIKMHLLFKDLNKDDQLYNQLRKIIFRMEPPSPEQFLDHHEGWLTKPFTESLYDHVKEDFCEILNPDKNYEQICEYGCTRQGKSWMGRLLIMYTMIYVHCLRHPQLYYGLAPTTSLSIYIMCFKEEKVKQLLLEPIFKFLFASPRFKNIRFKDKVSETQYKNGLENIYWSKAATFGEITMDSGLSLNLGTKFDSFIGADLLFLIVSEIAFFIQQAGATHEDIFKIYTEGRDRIQATVGKNYLGMVYLDTSANDTENPIEKYILNDLQHQDNVFFKKRARWEARPYLYPEWYSTGKTFKICTGDGHNPPKIIKNELELKDIPRKLIKDIPIDAYKRFQDAILQGIRNEAGDPTTKENKFITEKVIIDSIFSNPHLRNIEGGLIAEASNFPEQLLWNQIKDKFFINYDDKQNYIYRAPLEPRFTGNDLAHSIKGDVQGFCLLHKEWSLKRECIMYIIDFCFIIYAKESGINLEAITHLIMDLFKEGSVAIKSSGSDSFQSQTLIQYLKRNNIEAIKQSVDDSLNPYQYFLTCLKQGIVKAGKNIFLANNLDSLIEDTTKSGKKKIDHIKGKTNNNYLGDWNRSTCGINAKDCSDAVCQALWTAKNNQHHPTTIYEEENKKFEAKPEDVEKFVSNAWNKLHINY